MKLHIQCVNLSNHRQTRVSAMCWFSGKSSKNQPVLALCYETGKVQIMANESDECKLKLFYAKPLRIVNIPFSSSHS